MDWPGLDSVIAQCIKTLSSWVFCYNSSLKKKCEPLKVIDTHPVCLLTEWWSWGPLHELSRRRLRELAAECTAVMLGSGAGLAS